MFLLSIFLVISLLITSQLPQTNITYHRQVCPVSTSSIITRKIGKPVADMAQNETALLDKVFGL